MRIKLYWLLATWEFVVGNILDKAYLIMNTCKIYPDNEGKLGGVSKCQCCVNAIDLKDFNRIKQNQKQIRLK